MLKINLIKKVISYSLSQPTIFNTVRWIIAGNQANTKAFVRNSLQIYKVRSVLDVGCGIGDFVEVLPKNVDYVGVDINKKYISFARKKYKKEN